VSGVVHRDGEGEALFGGRIVIQADFESLSMTESRFASARPGAEPHVHRRHSDSFYVLGGEVAFLVHDEEHPLGPGGCVCVPPGVVHGFRSTSPARFLNFHTPDGGFAANLRALDRGEPGGFDSFDAQIGSGLSGSNAILLHGAEGERLSAQQRLATIKIGREELSLVEFELEPASRGLLHTPTTIRWIRSTCSKERLSSWSGTRVSCSAPARSWPRRQGSCTPSPAGPAEVGSSKSMRPAWASTSGFGRRASRALRTGFTRFAHGKTH
jgi:mannose-6-phosphate isomerase-like protein (cupin superfamily)